MTNTAGWWTWPAIKERDGRLWYCPRATPEEIAATVALWRAAGIDCEPA